MWESVNKSLASSVCTSIEMCKKTCECIIPSILGNHLHTLKDPFMWLVSSNIKEMWVGGRNNHLKRDCDLLKLPRQRHH